MSERRIEPFNITCLVHFS